MRKIEKEILRAIRKKKPRVLTKRDTVALFESAINVYLWDSCIFSLSDNTVSFSLHGYETTTTKSRVSALLPEFVPGCGGVFTKNYQLFLNWQGKNYPIDSSKKYIFSLVKNNWENLD